MARPSNIVSLRETAYFSRFCAAPHLVATAIEVNGVRPEHAASRDVTQMRMRG
jgi:hypothetical protein